MYICIYVVFEYLFLYLLLALDTCKMHNIPLT